MYITPTKKTVNFSVYFSPPVWGSELMVEEGQRLGNSYPAGPGVQILADREFGERSHARAESCGKIRHANLHGRIYLATCRICYKG